MANSSHGHDIAQDPSSAARGDDSRQANREQHESLLAQHEDAIHPLPFNETATESPQGSSLLVGKNNEATQVPSTELRHYPLVVYLTLAYSAIAIFAWTITCILVYRPITIGHYGLWLRSGDIYGTYYPSTGTYAANQTWLRAVRVLQSIIAIVTIPLASTVCASAAVTYVQRSCRSGNLTLRQTAVLADGGWTAIEVYEQLLRGRWKQNGSKLLYFAIVLHLLGALITPLQSVFTNTLTVQTPGQVGQIEQLTDFTDRLEALDEYSDQTAAAALRAAMVSTVSTDPQSRLWSASGATNCTGSRSVSNGACAFGQISLSNMKALDDAFVAQLPAGYNTGLIRQFLPRINSSVTRERITEAEFADDCGYQSTFFANYSTAVLTGYYNGSRSGPSWHLIACMTGESQRLISQTRSRQDLREQLYLNLSAYNPPMSTHGAPEHWSGLFRITLDTTSGYFELPNYKRSGLPGPLFPTAPADVLSDHNNTRKATHHIQARRDTVESNGTTDIPQAGYNVNSIQNKGPLLTTALALFGPGSFIADRVAHPENYINVEQKASHQDGCFDRVPFVSLLSTPSFGYTTSDNFFWCSASNLWNFGQLQSDLLSYVQLFIADPGMGSSNPRGAHYDDILANAFEAAAFLANEQWLTSARVARFSVNYDAGVPSQALHISEAGIILISVLLSIYLAALFGVAMYSNRDPRWTNRLDSLVMMQYGAAIADRLPMNIIVDRQRMHVLDETPGWIGDVMDEDRSVGELGLGGAEPLRAGRRYRCFEHDDERERMRGEPNQLPKELNPDYGPQKEPLVQLGRHESSATN
ncbi:hypothetical protein LTR15_006457 [Elasticomyces elasticus]|nr:hypothetical protein LTR15_006457 [Elasticomyces elasticus]